jgi:copper homeostasis protein (lipoprotein)
MMKLLFALAFLLGLSACSTVQSMPDEPLLDRYWRALEIDGKPVTVLSNRAEPHLVLASENRTHGSDGCNRFNGGYETSGQTLRFARLASTMMACIPSVDQMSREFIGAISATASYRIQGKQLTLLDGESSIRMRLEATALK